MLAMQDAKIHHIFNKHRRKIHSQTSKPNERRRPVEVLNFPSDDNLKTGIERDKERIFEAAQGRSES